MSDKPIRAAIYVRVSKGDQTALNQEQRLVAVAEQRGWQVVGTFEDSGLSGALPRDSRPKFAAMMRAAARGQFDVLMVWSIDRMGRSLRDLVLSMEELRAGKVDLYVDQQALDTTTPAGRAMYQMLGIFAEFELAIITNRIRLGIERARKFGTRSGAPIGRKPVSRDKVIAIEAALAEGATMMEAARRARVSEATVKTVKDGAHYWQRRRDAQAAKSEPDHGT